MSYQMPFKVCAHGQNHPCVYCLEAENAKLRELCIAVWNDYDPSEISGQTRSTRDVWEAGAVLMGRGTLETSE